MDQVYPKMFEQGRLIAQIALKVCTMNSLQRTCNNASMLFKLILCFLHHYRRFK